ncbi:hypothetical protein KP509_06G002000 [Ceratopteris richardii]|uniref:Pentatricopeptide repeat-containing protein n=1 Tax=Ceratopteris richardii TaxID=49495 RepID=A0A8T2UI20_CERRI|nr:hypothetical protein KP509_06G002000 [Ceratopteris richardii]
MYAKCGDFSKAQDVLQNLPFRDVVSWSALIAGYAKEGQAEQALKCFHRMQHEGIRPNAGKKIHDVEKNQGFLQNNVELGTALVDMYAKCGALSKAKCVFDSLLHRDVVCWNALIVGYMHDGQGERALDCFKRMKHDGITPNATTYACTFKACASIGACDEGHKIHDEIERQGLLEVDIMVGNALVDMYAKCGKLSKAQEVLHQLPFRDVVSWNALITVFAHGGLGEQALSCFDKMQSEGISPDVVSFLCILNVCSHLGLVDKGYEYFVNMTTKYGIIPNSKCFTCIIDLFGRAGHLEKAVQLIQEMPKYPSVIPKAVSFVYALKSCGVLMAIDKVGCSLVDMAQDVLQNLPFHDVVSWSALIAGYAKEGQAEQALQCFHRMQHEGIRPNAVTYACILKAYTALGALNEGKKIHDVEKNQGFCLLHRDVVCWNALIVGYMHDGQGERALDCFKRMKHDGITPNATTYACTLKACASIGACDEGHKIHDEIERQGLLEVDIMVGNALEGLGEQALSCFEKMQSEGISPDAVSFLCILNVCSHLGLVDKGYEYFVNMTTKYGIIPNSKCFTCIIDLFGRAGHLEKAVQLIQEMPVFDRSANWIALLSGSHKWVDIKVGRLAYEQVDKMHGPVVLLMANMYSSAEGGGRAPVLKEEASEVSLCVRKGGTRRGTSAVERSISSST